MNARAPDLSSKLPNVGTTIFTVMSALATERKAINLGQGFPDFNCDPGIVNAVTQAMQQGFNQYPPMAGAEPLRQAVAQKVASLYGASYNPQTEVTIAAGGTEAIFSAVQAVVRPGDEVIVLEPCYDSYIPAISLAGGTVVTVPLTPGSFRPDFAAIESALSTKTRLLIINTPHNPSAVVWHDHELLQLQALLEKTDTLLLSDEVYEHMVYAPGQHLSVSQYPGLYARAFVVSSFGKTFHVTGWKLGACVAPAALTQEFRKVHQFNVFTVNTPMQHGVANYMANPQTYTSLPSFYGAKRDRFRQGMQSTAFKLLDCQGSFFQCARYDGLRISERNLNEYDFCIWLTEEMGVAAIPLSVFYSNGFEQTTIRFCFAKQESTLDEAIKRLQRLG
ncbi:MAG: hypothetical protein RLZZ133_658 [Pseudomonadota bacterium]